MVFCVWIPWSKFLGCCSTFEKLKINTRLSARAPNIYSTKITQPEVRLRVGAFDVGVLIFSAAAILLASVHGKCLHYTEEVDVVFTEKNSSLFTLERGRWIRMLCDSSNLHKQKLVKPLISKIGRKTKTACCKMAAVKKVGQKKRRSRTSGWVSILWLVFSYAIGTVTLDKALTPVIDT